MTQPATTKKPSPRSSSTRREAPPSRAILRFTPYARAKLLYLRDAGRTEVGGFGITAADDLLLVEDVRLVHQACTSASVAFDDDAVADFFDAQVDRGLRPERFARIWVHTHPGNFPEPSETDEETFIDVFGRTEWAVMFILARGGRSYARLRFHVGPWADVELPVEVDYGQQFPASDHGAWQAEYEACVREPVLAAPHMTFPGAANRELDARLGDADGLWLDGWFDPFDEAVDPFFGYWYGYDEEVLEHELRP